MKHVWKKLSTLVIAGILCVTSVMCVFAKRPEKTKVTGNKYNVVFVIDESGSMKKTDADKLRYEATDLFLGLMTQEGNYAGTVSFDDQIIYAQDIMGVNSTTDKATISDAIKANTATNGDTDIGGALETAVSMLNTKGNPDLPSTIILLTDGNTDLDNDPSVVSEAEEASIEKKSAAIAEARDNGISVYSVCLNENGEADFSETKQISDATGGEAREVTNADDLKNVFEMFYQIIYGTRDNVIYEGTVPVTTQYMVPEAGVEEVNIMIEGQVSNVAFTDPSGNPYYDAATTQTGNITLEKIANPQQGEWTVSVDGDPGAKVSISLLYNYNFYVQDNTDLQDEAYKQGDEVSFEAQLTGTDGNPLQLSEDSAYAAQVRFVDENDNVTDSIPMEIKNGGFALDYKIPENDKAYRYYIAVSLKTDEENGNICKKTDIRQFTCGANTAPVSNGDIEATVKLWPFKDNVYKLDLTTLAKDAEDSTLSYSIVSTSFISKEDSSEGDYTLKGDTLTQDHFSLRKGEYVIRCVDSGGVYCDVKVTVSSINIGMLTVIGILIAILIAVAVAVFGIYTALKTPFYGDIYLKNSYDGDEIKRTKARGRINLNMFNVPITGIDGRKSYFQAMRGEGVKLVTNKEVSVNGRKGKEHVIPASGTGTEVMLDDSGMNVIYVRFASRLSGGSRRGRGNRRTAKPQKRMTASSKRSSRTTRGTRR